MSSNGHSSRLLPRVTKLHRHRHGSLRKSKRCYSSKTPSQSTIIKSAQIHPTNINKISSAPSTNNLPHKIKPIENQKSRTPKRVFSVTRIPRCHSSASQSNDKTSNNIEWTNEQDINSEISIENVHRVSDLRKRSSTVGKRELSTNVSNTSLYNEHSRLSFSTWSSRKIVSGSIDDKKIERKKRRQRLCGYYCCCSPICTCLCIFASLLITAAIAALLISLLIKSKTTTTSTTSTVSTTRSSVFNVNLITNGDAENGFCDMNGSVVHPTGWNYNGTITQMYYNSSVSSGQTFVSPGPNDRGQCYFTGHDSSLTTMWQIIDLTNYVDPFFIDSHLVNFNLSAWLGGFSNQDDNVRVTLTFTDQFNQTIGNGTSIGPVLAVDRGNVTLLVFRQTNGLVPTGSRFLTVFVTITRRSGTRNNGDIDNIAVILYS